MPGVRVIHRRAVLLVLLCPVALTACAGSGDNANLNYGDNARLAYSEALDEFYDDNCLEAEPMLRNVRREFPYTRFAALAELRLADCMFREHKYVEAIQAYRQFTRYRPSHVEIPYARYMVARSNFEQIPSEWLLSPPAHERDQHYAQESLRLIRRFLLDYPEDTLVRPAKRMADKALAQLARHEFYVASFYVGRTHLLAAVGRLRTLLRSYPGTELEPEALYLLGETYLDLQDPKGARGAFQELLKRFPGSEFASRARGHLTDLGG